MSVDAPAGAGMCAAASRRSTLHPRARSSHAAERPNAPPPMMRMERTAPVTLVRFAWMCSVIARTSYSAGWKARGTRRRAALQRRLSGKLQNRRCSVRGLPEESHMADRAGDDEHADVVRARIGRYEEEPLAVWPITERRADEHFLIEERHFHAASVAALLEVLLFDVLGVAAEVAHEEHGLQPRERHLDALVLRRVDRRPDGEVRARRVKIVREALEQASVLVANHDLLPARRGRRIVVRAAQPRGVEQRAEMDGGVLELVVRRMERASGFEPDVQRKRDVGHVIGAED